MKNLKTLLLSFYLWTTAALITVLVSSLILLTSPFALFDPDRRWAHRLGVLWAALLLKCNLAWQLRTVGREHLKKGRSYILVANHASLTDIVCLFSLNHEFKWLAKRSLFQVPFLGWAMSVMRYIPLERGQYGSIRTSYGEALGWLKKGVSILIFPEGTRSRTGEIGNFKSGAFKLALETGLPIVPIVLTGTQDVLSKGRTAVGKSGVAYLSVLAPIPVNGFDPKDEVKLRKQVEDVMREEFEKRKRMLASRD